MLLKVVLHVGKGAQFGVHKVNDGQDICSRITSVGNCEKQVPCSANSLQFNTHQLIVNKSHSNYETT